MFDGKTCQRLTIRFSDTPVFSLDQGIGVNWFHDWHLPETMPRSSTPPIADKEHGRLLMDELSFLRPASIRFGYAAYKFVDGAGRFNWDDEGFAVLKMLDEWALKNNASILFDPWHIPSHYSFAARGNVDCDAPADIPAFVEGFVVPLLKHVLVDMDLKSVTHFNLLNEPLLGKVYLTPPGIDRFEHYVECYRAVREAVAREDLPISLVGPDSCTMQTWAIDQMTERGLDLGPYVDAFDQHCYHARFDYLPPNPTIQVNHSIPMGNLVSGPVAMHAEFARTKKKKYYITELGTFYYGGPRGDVFGPCTHEAFITEAEFIIRAMQVGCEGFWRWAFLAPGEYGDGVWQLINTVDESYTRQPHTFFGYACLMRYTERGTAVRPATVLPREELYEHVQAVGLELSGGDHTVLVVNNHNSQERIIRIELPDGWEGRWQKLLDDRTRKMLRNDVEPVSGVIEEVLPPMSLAVYTTRRLPDDSVIKVNKCVQRPEAVW